MPGKFVYQNNMRKLILKMSVSVDGFVGGPNGEIDWLLKTMDDEAAQWVLDTIWLAGLHIMGSRTFHDMISYWPYSDEVFAEPMNEIPKAVFTRKGIDLSTDDTTTALKNASVLKKGRSLATVEADLSSWKNAEVITGDMKAGVERLKQQGSKPILAHGGAGFAQSLVRTGLVDEYRLLVHPFALGKGLPIFSRLDQPLHLELTNAIPFRGGVIALTYHPLEK